MQSSGSTVKDRGVLRRTAHRARPALFVAVLALAMLAGAAARAGDGLAQGAADEPDFTFAPTRGIGPFDGFGVQFNQHVYADISGPPQNLAALEREVMALRAPFVRIFFNTTAW